jgi:hypothetical protein
LTQPGEFEQVLIDTKATLVTEPCFKRGKAMLNGTGTGKVDHLAAAGAYQVVMVLGCASSVAGTVFTGVEFAYKFQFCQQFQGAVDGYQAYARAVAPDLLENCRRSKVVLAGGKGMYNTASLWCKPVSMPPEGGYGTFIRKFHSRC